MPLKNSGATTLRLEIEGALKPALVAEMLCMLVAKRAVEA